MFYRFIFLLTILILQLFFLNAELYANKNYVVNNKAHFSSKTNHDKISAIVVDAKTKRILYKQKIEELRYPASLTKLMTLYLLFECLESKKLKIDDEIKISKKAANQESRKLGLAAGSVIRIEDAIRSMVVLSANDIAVAVSEHIAGNEAKFATLMTKKANAIGMKKTKFKNASGLHHEEQVTTASDISKLALAMRRDFPQYYHYFSEDKFVFRNKVKSGHNKVLADQKNFVDGLKTGYTKASGFNLATSTSEKSGRPIVSVVMGSSTASARDNFMKFLIGKFSKKRSSF